MSGPGSYDKVDGRLALRYERQLIHPVQAVWEAVTQPAGLACWFPCRIEGELRAGGRLRFVFPADNTEVDTPSHGEVLDFDPPRRFCFTWEAEEMRIELEQAGDGGCVLTFIDLMPDDYAPGAARTGRRLARLPGHPGVPARRPGGQRANPRTHRPLPRALRQLHRARRPARRADPARLLPG